MCLTVYLLYAGRLGRDSRCLAAGAACPPEPRAGFAAAAEAALLPVGRFDCTADVVCAWLERRHMRGRPACAGPMRGRQQRGCTRASAHLPRALQAVGKDRAVVEVSGLRVHSCQATPCRHSTHYNDSERVCGRVPAGLQRYAAIGNGSANEVRVLHATCMHVWSLHERCEDLLASLHMLGP